MQIFVFIYFSLRGMRMANGRGRIRTGNITLARAFYTTGPSPTRSLHIATLEDDALVRPQANFEDVSISYFQDGGICFKIGDPNETMPERHLRGDPMERLDGLNKKRRCLQLFMNSTTVLTLLWCSAVSHHKVFMEIGSRRTSEGIASPRSEDFKKLEVLARFIQGKL